jgi:hypothetical protein
MLDPKIQVSPFPRTPLRRRDLTADQFEPLPLRDAFYQLHRCDNEML